jgi:hypothetical protein
MWGNIPLSGLDVAAFEAAWCGPTSRKEGRKNERIKEAG